MPYSAEHKAKSKDRIINAATELFSRFGFEKVSISQIMRLARMTHGAFYNHFESKEALYRAAFIEPLKGSRAARLVKGPLSLMHLTALVTHYWSLSEVGRKGRPGHEVILFNEIGSDNAEVRQLFETAYGNLKKMLETRITALSRLKKLPFEPDRELIAEKARGILSQLVGAVAVARSISDEAERRRILQSAQKQILITLGVGAGELDELLGAEAVVA